MFSRMKVTIPPDLVDRRQPQSAVRLRTEGTETRTTYSATATHRSSSPARIGNGRRDRTDPGRPRVTGNNGRHQRGRALPRGRLAESCRHRAGRGVDPRPLDALFSGLDTMLVNFGGARHLSQRPVPGWPISAISFSAAPGGRTSWPRSVHCSRSPTSLEWSAPGSGGGTPNSRRGDPYQIPTRPTQR